MAAADVDISKFQNLTDQSSEVEKAAAGTRTHGRPPALASRWPPASAWCGSNRGLAHAAFERLDDALVGTMGQPKEGPSAGLAMVIGIVSALTGRRVRHDVAVTGEITIMGKVLRVGGVQQKLRAACDAGVKEVLIPLDNLREAEAIPAAIRAKLQITPVQSIREALTAALLPSEGAA